MRATEKRKRGIVLLEAMLGVAIFAVGVLALADCVNNCIVAETARAEDARAHLALKNRMAEIESGAVTFEGTKTEKLKGMFEGITVKQSRTPLRLKNEKNEELSGLANVSIEVSWQSGKEPQSKAVSFYVLRAR